MAPNPNTRCSVCRSIHAHLVDAGLIAGASAKVLATQYGLGVRSIARHRLNCLPERVAESARVTEVTTLTAEALVSRVAEVEARAQKLVDDSERGGDIRERAAALRELRQTVELLAKLAFAAADRPAQTDEARPDIDALILQHVRNEAGQAPQPQLALGPGEVDDAEVVEAEVVG